MATCPFNGNPHTWIFYWNEYLSARIQANFSSIKQ